MLHSLTSGAICCATSADDPPLPKDSNVSSSSCSQGSTLSIHLSECHCASAVHELRPVTPCLMCTVGGVQKSCPGC
eukprot:5139083-Pleurochrysis_carterae.AAC.3